MRISKDLKIGSILRRELSAPFGILVRSGQLRKYIRSNDKIYAIGDVTVSTLLKLGIIPKLAVFDYMSERSRGDFPFIRKAYRRPVKVVNNRSELSLSLWKAVKRLSRAKDGAAIRVYGEEDLASLACIHFAKSGDIVIYGMRGRGMALIKVNKSIKRYVARVLKRMKSVEKH